MSNSLLSIIQEFLVLIKQIKIMITLGIIIVAILLIAIAVIKAIFSCHDATGDVLFIITVITLTFLACVIVNVIPPKEDCENQTNTCVCHTQVSESKENKDLDISKKLSKRAKQRIE